MQIKAPNCAISCDTLSVVELSLFDVCKVFVEVVARIPATIVVPCRRCQPTALRDMSLVKCNECHEVDGEAVPGAVFRCKDCNALKSRVHRLFQKPGMNKTEEVFKAMTKDEREKFFRDQHALMGDGLAAVMETLVTSKTTTTNSVSFKGTGEFFDEADLTEKYAKKPQQLASILRNTRKVYDSIRETTLFEDMKYSSCVANEEEESKAGESTITHEGKLKPKKAAKTEPKAKKEVKDDAAPDGHFGQPQISEGQAIFLHKFLEIFSGMQNELAAGLQVIDEGNLRDYVVAATLKQTQVYILKLQEFTAMLELSLETGGGDFKEMKGIESNLKVEGKELMKNMRLQIKTATLMKDGPKDKGKKRKVEVGGE